MSSERFSHLFSRTHTWKIFGCHNPNNDPDNNNYKRHLQMKREAKVASVGFVAGFYINGVTPQVSFIGPFKTALQEA